MNTIKIRDDVSESSEDNQYEVFAPLNVSGDMNMSVLEHASMQMSDMHHLHNMQSSSNNLPPGMIALSQVTQLPSFQQYHMERQQQTHVPQQLLQIVHDNHLHMMHQMQNVDNSQNQMMQQSNQNQQQQPVVSYVGKAFANEKDLRVWVHTEFGGMVNIHGKKYWRSGDNLAKYKSWTCSCKHEKKSGCKFKLYIAWTNKSVGPVIKTSHAIHSGHPMDQIMPDMSRLEYAIDDGFSNNQMTIPGQPMRREGAFSKNSMVTSDPFAGDITDETLTKMLTSMQNRENVCKRNMIYRQCQEAFDKFLQRELDLIAPTAVRRKVTDFITQNATPDPLPPVYHV